MKPYDEQRLRDEVIYLHSLWHQGPPTKRTRLQPNPNPRFHEKTKKKKEKEKMTATMVNRPESDSGAPWPCPPPIQAPPDSGWPETQPVYPPLTAQEVETHSALKIQLKLCNVFRELFVKSDDDESEDDEEGEDEEEEGEDEYWVGVRDEKSRVFLKIFMEDDELRRYFEANREGGEYCCFVCGALGKGKRFKSCLALAQHSASRSKTERNWSHWALGQVICKVLGWDFDRLPMLVLKGEPLSRSLNNAGDQRRDDNGGDSVEKEGIRGRRTDDRKLNHCCNGENGGVAGDDVVVADDNGGDSIAKEGVDNLQDDDGKCSKAEHEPSKEAEKEGSSDDDDEDEEEDSAEDGNEHETKDDSDRVYADSTVLKSGELGQTSEGKGNSQTPPSAGLEWPIIAADSVSAVNLLSAEEEADLAADQLQYKAARACQEFFRTISRSDTFNHGSEDGDEEDESEDSDCEDEDPDASEGSKVFDFFSKLFTEHVELREFYINNHESGNFCCLVCGGIGKKVWKRFPNCAALVQHSAAISRTKKKLTHRAYGKAISRVLGWDLNRFRPAQTVPKLDIPQG